MLHLFFIICHFIYEGLCFFCRNSQNCFNYFNRSYRDETGKMLGFWEAVRPLITPLIFFALSTIWVYQSPTNIIERDPRMVLFMVGTIFANVNVSRVHLPRFCSNGRLVHSVVVFCFCFFLPSLLSIFLL